MVLWRESVSGEIREGLLSGITRTTAMEDGSRGWEIVRCVTVLVFSDERSASDGLALSVNL